MAKERGNRLLKVVDRLAGIPLIYLLGLFRKKNKTIPPLNRVAFFISSALGDTLLISGIIRDLKENNPQVQIVIFAGSNYEAAGLIRNVDRVIAVRVTRFLQTIKKIRSHSFDLWIDTGQWARLNVLYSMFARSSCKIGFHTPGQHKHYLFDWAVRHNRQQHEMDNFRQLLAPLNIQSGLAPEIEVDEHLIHKPAKPYVVCHPFPGGYRADLKQWPEERWRQLILFFVERGYDVYLTGSRENEQEARELAADCGEKGKINVVAGHYSFAQTAALIHHAEMVVSVNTGTMHLASILQCNLVALHGPTDFRRWGPLKKNSISITSNHPCAPCLNLGFEYQCKHGGCMESITLQEVIDAVEKFLPKIK